MYNTSSNRRVVFQPGVTIAALQGTYLHHNLIFVDSGGRFSDRLPVTRQAPSSAAPTAWCRATASKTLHFRERARRF